MSNAPAPTLLCLSHLNWDFVWQRPQHLMSRLARRCPVIFVDPPEISAEVDRPTLQERGEHGGVRVLRPLFPTALLDTPGHSYQELWLGLLPQTLALAGPRPILWVFSPLADYLVEAARPQLSLAIYDCMDDLASFRGSPASMREREDRLLAAADLAFTGGRSMYEARRGRHPDLHCFPSGVDVAHYAGARDPGTAVPAALEAIPAPRLGYFGVLDERIDWELIAEVAARRPDWHWALVGPTAKVDPEELPQAPNIHYLGQQQYADLPAFLRGFDVATMPFALNQATRFISPTKTTEYLAGGKPVISSSVPDVAATYTGIVEIADGAEAWAAGVERLLAEDAQARAARAERAAPILERSAWDDIAAQMWALITQAMGRSGQRAA